MKSKVYAQIYSLLRQDRKDTLKALKTLSEIGYDGVELLGTFTGTMTREEFRQYLTELRLIPISSHAIHTEEELEFGRYIGIRFCDMNFSLGDGTRDAILAACEKLNEQGALHARYGIKGVLHNHANEFGWVKGEEGQTRIYDLVLENTDPALVGMELDVGWVARAGVDPVEYIRQNSGRFDLIHVKSCNAAARTPEELEHFPAAIMKMGRPTFNEYGAPIFPPEMEKLMYESRSWNRELGSDLIDWKALVAAAEAQGCQGYISEREYYHAYGAEGDPVKCAVGDYEFLRSL